MQGIKENKIKMKWLCLSQDDIDRISLLAVVVVAVAVSRTMPRLLHTNAWFERGRGRSVGAQCTGLHASSNHEGDKCDSDRADMEGATN